MTRDIVRKEGIWVGNSAGSAMAGLMQLKDKLKKDDLVVCIFHDHGSRYVAKIYNDQWMMERGFLDVKTFRDIVNARGANPLVTMTPDQTVGEAVDRMKDLHIENIPVVESGIPVGAVSESGLFNIMLSNGSDIRNKKIQEVIESPYPVVAFDTALERISLLISKENGAVLARDDSGNFHIVTKYDVLQSFRMKA
jgi:cystathionine beta-synthase